MSRPVRQLGAVVGAAVLIIAAIIVRDQIDGDATADGATDSPIHLICDPLFKAACSAVPGATVTVEAPSETVKRLSGAALGADGWVTSDLWTSIATSRSPELGWLTENRLSVLGAANPILVGLTTRIDALASACGAALDWKCVGDHAGRSFTDIKAGLAGKVELGYPPTTTTIGLATVAAIVSSYLRRTDFASNDLDDPGFQDWFANVKDATVGRGTPAQTPLQSFLQIPANYAVVGDLSTSNTDLRAVASSASIKATDSTPNVRVRAVVASPNGRAMPVEQLTEELRSTWNADVNVGSLPNGGVLDALSRL